MHIQVKGLKRLLDGHSSRRTKAKEMNGKIGTPKEEKKENKINF